MNFNDLDILTYSSMKTSTQSLVHTFQKNKLKSYFMHNLNDLAKRYPTQFLNATWDERKNTFLSYLENYKTINKKKLNIITVIRNPMDRIKSAFFEAYHNEEIKKNIAEENTTINRHNVGQLINLFLTQLKENRLPGSNESLDDLSKILDTDIIHNLKNKTTHYYYENHLIKLYVLNFNAVVSSNALNYLNAALNLNLKIYIGSNKSENKSYYNKYKLFKEKCETKEMQAIIYRLFKPFYFIAFAK